MTHSDSSRSVETIWTSDMTLREARAIGELLVRVWPKPGVTVDDRATQVASAGGGAYWPREIAPRSFVIQDGGKVVAHAGIFPRTIGTSGGQLTIAALARVATDPDYRGQRLGAAVVRGVFALVDEGLFPFSLFQTSDVAKRFYEQLDCQLVENSVRSSTLDDPLKCPFWDKYVMRYPASGATWPSGDIDLRGPGY